MTPREVRLAVTGLLVGLLLAAATPFAYRRVTRWRGALPAPPAASSASSEPPAVSSAPAAAGPAATLPTAQLTDDEQKAIGLQTAAVARRRIDRFVLTTGRVEEAETSRAAISARVSGRLDKLFVEFTGQNVRRGQPIAEIYSPELVTGAEEYRLALESRRQLPAGALPDAVNQADELVRASRRRLELWGLSPQQISDAASPSQRRLLITIYASADGIVTERKVTEGQYVKEGDVLYTLNDLSTVWVKADVYESDLPLVRVGQMVEVTSEALPRQKLAGRVGFVEPMVNPQTRTAVARLSMGNPKMLLRPGMFINVRLAAAPQEEGLVVPRAAVLDSGMRKLVYVAKGEGVFQARQVEVGPPGEDFYPVLAGLKQGERVVTHGAFMLDSQTRITGGMTGLFGGSREFGREPQVEAGKPQAPAAAGQALDSAKVSFRTEPDPPKGGAQNRFRVNVTDASGKPIADAQVRVTLVMPAMPSMGMPEMRSSVDLAWNGKEYQAAGNISMAGPWNVTVEVTRGSQRPLTHRTRINAVP